MYHEIGHNLGNYKWLFKGNTEVANNLVALLQIERLSQVINIVIVSHSPVEWREIFMKQSVGKSK